MEEEKKSLQDSGATSKDSKEISFQVPGEYLKHLNEGIQRAGEIISFSNSQGWSKTELLTTLNIIQSLEHFS